MNMRIQKWGNSLALRIPKSFAKEAHIDQGATVDISVKDGKLIIAKPARTNYTLDKLLAGISRKNIHQEWKTSQPMGKEAW
jgi:antitoxin MazE